MILGLIGFQLIKGIQHVDHVQTFKFYRAVDLSPKGVGLSVEDFPTLI